MSRDEKHRGGSLEDAVIAAELRMLDPRVRTNAAAVENLLDPSFREIGRSGRLWSRDEMVAALREPEMSAELGATEPTELDVQKIDESTYLLTYLIETDSGTRRRSSIWRMDGRELRIVFHQGTPVLP